MTSHLPRPSCVECPFPLPCTPSWPCIFQWMEARRQSPTCPVCKSVIDKERLIPLYGRGNSTGADPRYTDPATPFCTGHSLPHMHCQP